MPRGSRNGALLIVHCSLIIVFVDIPLRILDANLNRAREGLRTAEEYARLGLNDVESSAQIKAVRGLLQQFVDADPALAARLLESRDVGGDVGVNPGADAARSGLADIARAGMKRAQEALRVIEETAQLVVPAAAGLAARARYAAYAAEQQLFVAAPRRAVLRQSPVMVIFTRSLTRDWPAALRGLTQAGASLFQLREKDAEAGEFTAYAREFIARAPGALVLVNDRADVAVAASSHGVHVGQRDLSAGAARQVVGPARMVGVSTHDLAEARAAAEVADYIGLGAMFPTASKKVESFAQPKVVQEVLAAVGVPVFCIGGIGPENVGKLRQLSVKQVAAGASILGAKDPAAAFKALCEGLKA